MNKSMRKSIRETVGKRRSLRVISYASVGRLNFKNRSQKVDARTFVSLCNAEFVRDLIHETIDKAVIKGQYEQSCLFKLLQNTAQIAQMMSITQQSPEYLLRPTVKVSSQPSPHQLSPHIDHHCKPSHLTPQRLHKTPSPPNYQQDIINKLKAQYLSNFKKNKLFTQLKKLPNHISNTQKPQEEDFILRKQLQNRQKMNNISEQKHISRINVSKPRQIIRSRKLPSKSQFVTHRNKQNNIKNHILKMQIRQMLGKKIKEHTDYSVLTDDKENMNKYGSSDVSFLDNSLPMAKEFMDCLDCSTVLRKGVSVSGFSSVRASRNSSLKEQDLNVQHSILTAVKSQKKRVQWSVSLTSYIETGIA